MSQATIKDNMKNSPKFQELAKLPPDELKKRNKERMAKLRKKIDERRFAKEDIGALKELITGFDETDIRIVTHPKTGQKIRVRTAISGDIEMRVGKIDKISRALQKKQDENKERIEKGKEPKRGNPDLHPEMVREIIHVLTKICTLPNDEPNPPWDDEEGWLLVYQKTNILFLATTLKILMEPAKDRIAEVEKFRDE